MPIETHPPQPPTGGKSAARNPAVAQPELANAENRYAVTRADLPLSCPMPSMTLWNSHPRVYMPIVEQGGHASCPYCGARFDLVD